MDFLRRAVTVLAISAVTGCGTTTVVGDVSPGKSAREATELASFLLSPDEINSAMASTGMVPGSTQSTLVDDAGRTTPEDCLAASSVGQERVYSDTGWTAVRIQSLHEPVEDFDHLAHQAVVQFPSGIEATAFLTRSTRAWEGCARGGRFTYRPGGTGADVTWLVGSPQDRNGTLEMSTPQQDGDGWACLRALTAAVNVVVDVMTCSYRVDDRAATDISRQIADRITGQ